MKRLLSIIALVVVIFLPSYGQDSPLILSTDTIFRVDTVETKEVITRSEIIHRTEKVIRIYDNGILREQRINEDGSVTELAPEVKEQVSSKVAVVDTVYQPGGRYIWVPDSMNSKVNSVLEGSSILPEFTLANTADKDEKVVFRGDTINMILKDRNLGRFDRGLFNYLFIPRGIWQVGITASYGEFSTADLQILDLISDIDFNGKIWSVKPYFSYFLRSNLSLGLRLGYSSGKASIGSFNVDVDEDISFNLHDIYYKSNSYSAAVTFAQYLGITRRGRFGFFNEVELALAGGDSDFNRPYNGQLRKTHTTTFQTSLNFSPGVCVYVLDQVSFNVSFGVFGLYLKNEKQKVDGEKLGSRTTSGANFRFNIFNINFGLAVNI